MNSFKGVPVDYKNPSLRRWRVKEVVWINGSRTRHVYGHDVANDAGRASSSIREFDLNTMTAISYSGRNYKLLGVPGNARSGESAWENWCKKNVVVTAVDVTDEYFNVDRLFAIEPAIVEISDKYLTYILDGEKKVGIRQVSPIDIYSGLARAMIIMKSARNWLQHYFCIVSLPRRSIGQLSKTGEKHMKYRYSRRLAILQLTAALVMLFVLDFDAEPKLWGWLLFLPFFLFVLAQSVRTFIYSLTINDDTITLVDIEKSGKYPVSEISAINVWHAKGDRIAVITFSDRRKLSFPGHLDGFDDLVESLRNQTKLKFES